MKDYSAMDDFEINKAVAIAIDFPCYYGNGSYTNGMGMRQAIVNGINCYGSQMIGGFDPCNNPADAWPIILENKINIDHRDTFKAGPMASMSGRKDIYAVDKNPLRASMIVFLMMKDEALNTQGGKV